MDYVPLPIHHDVAVVSVLHVEKVAKARVSRQRADEVLLSFFKLTAKVPLVELS